MEIKFRKASIFDPEILSQITLISLLILFTNVFQLYLVFRCSV